MVTHDGRARTVEGNGRMGYLNVDEGRMRMRKDCYGNLLLTQR